MSSQAESTIPLWIDNEAVSTSFAIPVTQASSSNVVHYASSASTSDAIKAVDSSWKAFVSWRQTTHVTRRDLILRVAAYYESHIDGFVARQIEETSCTEAWAKQNVGVFFFLRPFSTTNIS